jgi:hypothetical protein
MQVNSAHPDSGIADLDNGSVKFMLHGRQKRGSAEDDYVMSGRSTDPNAAMRRGRSEGAALGA